MLVSEELLVRTSGCPEGDVLLCPGLAGSGLETGVELILPTPPSLSTSGGMDYRDVFSRSSKKHAVLADGRGSMRKGTDFDSTESQLDRRVSEIGLVEGKLNLKEGDDLVRSVLGTGGGRDRGKNDKRVGGRRLRRKGS